jgi:formamidopyrimidine-DNA glycosylase
MPELPEVETTRRGLEPHLVGRTITAVVVRDGRLRWPVSDDLAATLTGRRVRSVARRGKYLLFDCGTGTLIVHLGMSGSLRVAPEGEPPGPWDHVELAVGRQVVRLRDPRRFGAILWHPGGGPAHALLAHLGVEPLDPEFNTARLHRASRGRRVTIKQFLMNAAIVVGIGNIYASESLFLAGIDPRRRAGRLSRAACGRLVAGVRETLERAIAAGGTSLRDYVASDGAPGEFQLDCFVYGREGEPCRRCGRSIRRIVQGGRSTYFCAACQK